MTKGFVVAALFVILLGAYWYIGGWRVLLSVWLIWQIEPYQREISQAPKILVIGDSTAYGTGADAHEDSIAGRIAHRYPSYSIRTIARNGLRTEGLAQQIETIAQADEYALVLLQIGANDVIGGVDNSVSESSMRHIINYIQPRAQAIVWMSSGNVGGARAYSGKRAVVLEERSREFRVMAQSLAEELGVKYVDLFQERDVDLFVLEPDIYMAVDGLHPSSAGYGLWFSELQPTLDQFLDR